MELNVVRVCYFYFDKIRNRMLFANDFYCFVAVECLALAQIRQENTLHDGKTGTVLWMQRAIAGVDSILLL